MPPSKQDIISHVFASVMRILQESSIYGTSQWPKHGFSAGSGTENIEPDTAKIGIYLRGDNWERKSVCINIFTSKPIRAARQARAIDMVLDQSIINNIYFENDYRSDLPPDTRYNTRWWFNELKYIQISYSFTLLN